jgi:alkaline phosphatase D
VLDWWRAQGLVSDPKNLPAGFYIAPDVPALTTLLSAPDRQLMGAAQEQWLADELRRSVQGGVTWQVLGNQILMAPVNAPDLSATPPQLADALERLLPGIKQQLKLTRFAFPLNTDSWDGYPGARARALGAMRAAGGNVLVVTGDTHTAWANEVNDAGGRVAVEFGATSISSPGDGEYFAPFGIDFAAGVRARNPHVKYSDSLKRGFLLLTLTPEQATAEFFVVSNITSKEYELTRAAAFTVAPEAGASVGAITAA